MSGIVSYGVYIPKYRIKSSLIARQYQKDPKEIFQSLNIYEKSVPARDEDTFTMAYEASKNALKSSKIDSERIESVLVGSESKPYAVKPTAAMIADVLDLSDFCSSADLEFACKAGSQAVQIVYDSICSKRIDYGLAVGSDSSQAETGDILEYGTGAGAAAFILGRRKVIAEIIDTISYTKDIPDFWRAEDSLVPEHRERFSALTYINTIKPAVEEILKRNKKEPRDFDYVVFHMPNGSLPRKMAKILGFSEEQLKTSLSVEYIGNTYSASSLIGLAKVLDIAKPNEKILFASYGSGAGSDVFIIKTTKNIKDFQKRNKFNFNHYIKKKEYLDYSQYLYNKKVI